ncbi:Uncharacterised protein [Vibrio cholerae]|nr:Uncharacterised protein [Vibrio cholerae]
MSTDFTVHGQNLCDGSHASDCHYNWQDQDWIHRRSCCECRNP